MPTSRLLSGWTSVGRVQQRRTRNQLVLDPFRVWEQLAKLNPEGELPKDHYFKAIQTTTISAWRQKISQEFELKWNTKAAEDKIPWLQFPRARGRGIEYPDEQPGFILAQRMCRRVTAER